MRCPDCGHDFPAKPEVVKEKEPCKCGLTADVRITKLAVTGFICLILSLLGGCWISSYYTVEGIRAAPGTRSDKMPFPRPVLEEGKK